VALLPLSIEIQPSSLRFVHPNPHVACHTRMPKGLEVINDRDTLFPSEPTRKLASDLTIKTPRGLDLHLILVLFLDTLLFDWPCANGRTCVEFCGEVATLCLYSPSFVHRRHFYCKYTQCVALVASSKDELKTQTSIYVLAILHSLVKKSK